MPVPMKQLVFKSYIEALHTAKRKVRLGVDDVQLSTGYPGIWDNADNIKDIKDDASNVWYAGKGQPGSDHPEGQDQLTK